MSFNCSIVLRDLDINCNNVVTGGIKKVIVGLQRDLDISLDPNDETRVTSVALANHVNFDHNTKDSYTVFNESKSISNGLGVVNTQIEIQIPVLNNKLNIIDLMSRREDLVCIMKHNNGTVTISGWMDGLTMNYEATSGVSKAEKSVINLSLVSTSWISSLTVNDTSVFADPTILD